MNWRFFIFRLVTVTSRIKHVKTQEEKTGKEYVST